MKLQPERLVDLPDPARARIVEIERDFHERKFGEELARVNWELTPSERWEYLAWMRSTARRSGVVPQPSYSVAWLLKLEEKLSAETEEKSP